MIIYGFGGTNEDIAHLEAYLENKGMDTHVVTLAGHGGTKWDLHKTSHMDWLESAKRETADIAKNYDKVNLVGFSMGGLLSLHLSDIVQDGKIVLINTPIYCWNLGVITRSVISDLRSGERDNISYYMKNSGKYSAKSIIDFFKLLHMSKRMLTKTSRECLVLQCMEDEIVHHKSGDYLKDKLGENAKLKYYDGGFHQVFVKAVDIRDDLCEDIYSFLRK